MAGSASLFDPSKPEFSIDLPRKLGGSNKKAGAEAYHDDDIASLPTSNLTSDQKTRISIPAPGGSGVVTQLKANPTDRREERSKDVDVPPSLSKPMEKKASSAPEITDELAEIIGTLPAADLEAPEPELEPEPEKDAAAAKRSKESMFFSSSFATPAELDQTLIDKYGILWLEWTPETLWQTIRMDFNTQISAINQDKMNAVMLLHVSDSFWRHWETFEKVVLAFNNVTPHFDRRQDVTVGQMLHAALQAHHIRKEVFQPEVLSYVAVQAREEGFLWLPEPLDVAQPRLDSLNPAEMVPLKKEIRERWDAFQEADLRGVEFKEDVYGIHLAKLASIDLYLKSMASPELQEEL